MDRSRRSRAQASHLWRANARPRRPDRSRTRHRSRRGYTLHRCPFDCEHAQFRCCAAMRREAADLAGGRKHAMARHDNREWVLPEGLTHRPSGTTLVKPRGDVTVGKRLTRRDAARDLVDAAMEERNILYIEFDGREIDRLSLQQGDNMIDRAPHLRWR